MRVWKIELSGGPLGSTNGNALVWAEDEHAADAALRRIERGESLVVTSIEAYASPRSEILMVSFPRDPGASAQDEEQQQAAVAFSRGSVGELRRTITG